MNRRGFMGMTSATAVGLVAGKPQHLPAQGTTSDRWRTFEVKTRVEVLTHSGQTRVWLPTALLAKTPFQNTISNACTATGGVARLIRGAYGLGIIAAEFPAGVKPILTLTSRIATRDHRVNLSAPRSGVEQLSQAERQYFLRPTKLLPTDGIVKTMAIEITRSSKTDLEKARAIYDWIVENTFRDPKILGCGRGDIRSMLETRYLGGKCADLNALYVGLARAVGLPAREVYGIRVAKSELGYESLGTSSEDITKAQHCRAEVYIAEYGWVPVDPADVRKVVLEEPPGNRQLGDEMVRKVRARLFGSWEMNWIGFNFAHDVTLPNSAGGPVAFLMYPQAETANGRLDSLDPRSFKYEIASKEIFSQ